MNSFTQRNLKWFGAAVVVVVLAAGFFWISRHSGTTELQKAKFTLGKKDMPKVRSSFSPKNTDDAISRIEWEINRFKDPTLGRVPNNIRERELAFARNIPTRESLGKTNSPGAVNWSSRGPYNVGGRTRALATDLDYNGSSNQRILAGGISGGMYRSENGGNSWTLTTALDAHASVTCVAQDPSNHNTWYYGTGEYIGNSANGRFSANFYGHGMFKSTNGGASWTQLASTSNNDPQVFDDFFDFVWNVVVTSNGTVFAATYGGILRSTDGGSNWSLVLGRNQSPYSSATDVAVAANGDIYATLSRNGTNITEYGVYRSTNNGANWSNITPTGMNTDPNRIVIATAPSDGNTAYAFIQFGNGARASDHQLYRYNASGNSWSNLSANIPDFSDNFGGQVGVFSSQGGYDLLVKVKPDNANVLWLGGTNLVRSTNGGSSFEWVGGYHPQNFVWDNHHSDQHSITFLPNNPNAMISGSDGGLSFTNNCLASPQTWSFINNGYLTTQFYAISIDAQGGNELVGGLQDNGTWIAQTADPNTAWISIFSGDGAYNAISPGGSAYYVSSQQGNTFRITFPGGQQTYSNITPAGGQNFQFVNPFFLDPNNAQVMYMTEGNKVWRNSNLAGIPDGNQNPTNTNWTALSNSAVSNTAVTIIGVSTTPANRIYFGATDYQSTTVLKRLDNAQNNPAGTVVTPPVTQGSYPYCIAVNPNNGDEVIAVFSNYGIDGLWHSTNGGGSWTSIEGNLGGNDSPSLRWAVIHPTGSGTMYYLATSTGVYSTSALSGGSTTWIQEGAGVIGNAVTDMLVSRTSDNLIVAGTHGRGAYSGIITGGGGSAVASVDISQLNIELQPGTTRSRGFTLRNTGSQTLNYSISVSGFGAEDGPGNRALLRTDNFERIGLPTSGENPVQVQVAGKAGDPDSQVPVPNSPLVDVLFLDDGNATPDDFVGSNDFNDFYWANAFPLGSDGYSLSELQFYMRTESNSTNTVYVGVYSDLNGTALAEGILNLNIAPNGNWFTATLNPAIQFNPNETFYLVVGADGFISFPAGFDYTATVPNNSFYFDVATSAWVNVNTIPAFANGAFLVRASGDYIGGSNNPPTAVANVPSSGQVNQSVTFDGSGSFDTDGSITAYAWNFGDGTNANQAVASHSYSSAGTFTWSLTVTDDDGATGQTSGQITITGGGGGSRLTVAPTSGTVAPGGSQTITATYDAIGQNAGTYNGTIQITGNGGTINLPVSVFVDPSVGIDDDVVVSEGFSLGQNYPNPFNPTTEIAYRLENSGPVSLTVYNSLGQKVRTLVNSNQPAGAFQVRWDARNDQGQPVVSGVYIYTLRAGQQTLTRKMTLTR